MPELDFAAGASWVLPWLGGLVLLSYLGNYPEPAAGNLNILTSRPRSRSSSCSRSPSTRWRMKFCLPTAEMERHIESTRAEAELEEQELEGTH